MTATTEAPDTADILDDLLLLGREVRGDQLLGAAQQERLPGGAAGLQNQSGGRKVLGGFDSLPSPPCSVSVAPHNTQLSTTLQ